MTSRAVMLGLLGVGLWCSSAYFVAYVIRQGVQTHSHMPYVVYGCLIAFLFVVNPLLGRVREGLRLRGGELAVIMALITIACAIPSSGLFRSFTAVLMMPHHYERVKPGWQENQLVAMAPRKMLARTGKNDEALTGYLQGLSQGGEHISLSDIPWYAWWETLAYWLPMVLALWIASIGLALLFHRQWVHHEQLPYPIATITNALLPVRGGRINPIFRNRLFLIGLSAIVFFSLNNFVAAQNPNWIPINYRFLLYPLIGVFPLEFLSASGLSDILNFNLFFVAIGIGYLLPSTVAFSLGIGPIAFGFVAGSIGLFFGFNIRSGGIHSPHNALICGIYLGILATLLFTGRHFYLLAIRRALFIWSAESVDTAAVAGVRVFLVSFIVFLGYLMSVRLDWQIALLYGGFIIMTYIVMARILAESGLYFNSAQWSPPAVLLGLMGAGALGVESILLLGILTSVLLPYGFARETLMAFVSNSFRLLEMRRVSFAKATAWCSVALVLGLAIALPVTLFWQYDGGTDNIGRYAIVRPPTRPFAETLQVKRKLVAQGALEAAAGLSGWNRFLHLAPDYGTILGLSSGFFLVVLFTFLRLRFARFPLHSVLFATWIMFPVTRLAISFLMGWAIKLLVVRFGGEHSFQQVRPLMIGIIAGDLLGRTLVMGAGLLYFFITGENAAR